MNNFEDFLRHCLDKGHVPVKLVPRICKHGKVHFSARGGQYNTADGVTSSETFKAVVEGKHVRRVGDDDGKATMFDMLELVANEDPGNTE